MQRDEEDDQDEEEVVRADQSTLRDNQPAAIKLFGRAITEAEFVTAIAQACRAIFCGERVQRVTTAAATVATAAAAAADAGSRADGEGVNEPLAAYLVACARRGSWLRGYYYSRVWRACYVTFFRDVAKLDLKEFARTAPFVGLARYGHRYTHARFCIVAARATIYVNARNVLHNEHGPAASWPDGQKLYYWNGVRVPAEWIDDKANVDPTVALTHPSIEQRRCLAEILGWSKVLAKLNPTTIDADDDPAIGTLVDVDLLDSPRTRFLRMRCATGRDFAACVPRECTTALQAQSFLKLGRIDPNFQPPRLAT